MLCQNVIPSVEPKNALKRKWVHNENVGEVVTMKAELEEISIIHRPSTPYCPQKDWLAEGMNHSLMDKVRAMLNGASIP